MSDLEKNRIIAVVGPTASGKTALSVELCKAIGGEVVSIDSMQIYKGMKIGTAAPYEDEMQGIPHHLIGEIEPNASFSVADYVPMARRVIDGILERGLVPILCGGTGLYLDSIVNIGEFSTSVGDPEIRRELEIFAKENGNEALHEMLRGIDPDAAEAIHMNNTRRVIRAIEIHKTTGLTKTEWDKKSKVDALYDRTVIYLDFLHRDLLYERIDRRVDIMFDAGLEEEVRKLYDGGMLKEEMPAYQAIGYKEFIPYFKGEKSLIEVSEEIKQATRRYSKRQQTWFKRYGDAIIIHPDNENKEIRPFNDILAEALEKIRISGII